MKKIGRISLDALEAVSVVLSALIHNPNHLGGSFETDATTRGIDYFNEYYGYPS